MKDASNTARLFNTPTRTKENFNLYSNLYSNVYNMHTLFSLTLLIESATKICSVFICDFGIKKLKSANAEIKHFTRCTPWEMSHYLMTSAVIFICFKGLTSKIVYLAFGSN